jgi:hypothetical protein
MATDLARAGARYTKTFAAEAIEHAGDALADCISSLVAILFASFGYQVAYLLASGSVHEPSRHFAQVTLQAAQNAQADQEQQQAILPARRPASRTDLAAPACLRLVPLFATSTKAKSAHAVRLFQSTDRARTRRECAY